MLNMTEPCERCIAWINHCVNKLIHLVVPARPDRRFPVCWIGGVTAQEYLKAAHFIWTGGSLNTGPAALPHKNIHLT